MKKLIATFGSFLLFLGLKAQTETIKKETTPQVKSTVQTSAQKQTIKDVSHKEATISAKIGDIKGATIKGVSPRDSLTIKNSSGNIKGATIKDATIKDATIKGSTIKDATIKDAAIKGSTIKGDEAPKESRVMKH